jgi:hypothetical protein
VKFEELEALLKKVVQARRAERPFWFGKNDVPRGAQLDNLDLSAQTSIVLDLASAEPKNRLSENAKRCFVKGETSRQGEVVPWWLRYQRDKRELAGQLKIGPDKTGKFSMKAAAKEGKKAGGAGRRNGSSSFKLHEGLCADLEWSNKFENLTDSDSQPESG